MELQDRIAVVTGGASGIGRESARLFAAEGAKLVVVADVDGDKAAQVAAEIGSPARGVALDVADETAIVSLCDEISSNDGPIDLFFSNAGYGLPGGLDLDNDAWSAMIDVHFTSHLSVARALVPSMVDRGDGYLFSTASAAGLLTQIDSGPYAVSKAAAVAFAEWLSINYGPSGIKVSVLCPQAVRTNIIGDDLTVWDEMEASGQASQDGVLSPEDVAAAVVQTIRDESFLCLPHAQVATYMQRKASDVDRWIGGMQRFKTRLDAAG